MIVLFLYVRIYVCIRVGMFVGKHVCKSIRREINSVNELKLIVPSYGVKSS